MCSAKTPSAGSSLEFLLRRTNQLGRGLVAGLESNHQNNILISILLLGSAKNRPHTLPHIFVNLTAVRFFVWGSAAKKQAVFCAPDQALRPLPSSRQAQRSGSTRRISDRKFRQPCHCWLEKLRGVGAPIKASTSQSARSAHRRVTAATASSNEGMAAPAANAIPPTNWLYSAT